MLMFFSSSHLSPRINLDRHFLPAAQASSRKATHRSTQCSFQCCSGPETCACILKEEDRQRLHNLLGHTAELIQCHRFQFSSCKIKIEHIFVVETPQEGEGNLKSAAGHLPPKDRSFAWARCRSKTADPFVHTARGRGLKLSCTAFFLWIPRKHKSVSIKQCSFAG